MLTKTLAALALACSLTACHDRVVQVSPAPPVDVSRPGQMTVTAQATLEVSPDCADLTITLAGNNVRPGAATKELEGKKGALVAALGKLGVELSEIKVSTLTLRPIFRQNADGIWTSRVDHYQAELTITATTRDFGKIGDILDAAANAGATTMNTEFRRSDLPELKKKVRDMALTAAKDKAKQTAGTLGIKLGRIVSVAENQGGYMWNATYFPQNAAAVQDAHVALGGTLQPLTLDVTIGYELATET
jgi:uncharacterized protein YggE